MSSTLLRSAFAGCLLLQVPLFGAAAPETLTPPTRPAYVPPTYAVAQQLYFDDKLPDLDPLVAKLVAEDKRDEDGQPELMLVTRFLGQVAVPRSGDLETGRKRTQAWMQAQPDSPFAPIMEALRLHETAWRARGGGYSEQVTDEGWEIFREQSQAAWKLLMDSRKQSSRIPTWYSLAISTGRDGKLPEPEIRQVFDEGKKRFPGYFQIQQAYLREFAPRWGGDYASAKAFILQQVNDKANKAGDELYTRLYWALDGYAGTPAEFVSESGLDWPRMRKGFELMLERFPKSLKNPTVFGAYACRARDAETYQELRPRLTGDNFREFVPSSLTLEVCDRRFTARPNAGT